ncbi:RNA polymerase II degradation factor 1-like [Anopheles stephensi]|uniref:RNA polymerase II degradation factor 1-like n=1 Tax=Anopheles stephensi TaxID=30069 RepID=UPI001658B8C1|nr:RNA polymerase II degradation factor 1-like [Anopheles stephensi]
MKFMKNLPLALVVLLACSSYWAAGQQQQQQQNQQSVQPEQPHAVAAGENGSKNVAGVVDKSQNKRGAPDIPVVVGTPAQHTAYINHHVTGATVVAAPISGHATHAAIGTVPFGGYGHAVSSTGAHILQTPTVATGHQHVIQKVNYVAPASPATTLKLATVSEGSHLHLHPVSTVVTKYNYAVPQLTYTHYPQYQVYHHHQASPGTVQPAAAAAIYTAHQLHEHPEQHQQQQQQQHTAYAHQQPIYAHHPAAIHYTIPASLIHAGQHNYQQQPHHPQQQQQQQLPLSHTQAIHYQPSQAGAPPAVPIVHQAPIATINQVHQAQQVYATQGQLTKYPLAAQSYYGAGGLQQNQIYSTVPSYAFHQHAAGSASNGLAGKQLLPTVATPVHLKSLVPVTTATTTQHHGNGISYTAFTQPSHVASIPLAAAHLKPVPQGVLQTQPSYYSTAATSNVQQQANVYYRNQLQQQQQQQQQAQQQQRVQIYSTAASPLQKSPLLYSAGKFSHPVPSQYAAYAYAPQQQQHPQHQSVATGALFQPQASLGKITYAQNAISPNVGGRGSIYLLH